jgi:hypothetical protein
VGQVAVIPPWLAGEAHWHLLLTVAAATGPFPQVWASSATSADSLGVIYEGHADPSGRLGI